MNKPRVLLLSAYDADSHAYWRRGLVANLDEFHWTQLTLPPRYFSWRIRGNGLIWSASEQDTLTQSYDLVIATSMVDLATLRGLVPSLGQIPTVVYFHENQFAYPKSEHQHQSLEPQMVNLYSALCADKVLFNSEYNRDSFLAGVASFLRKMPDFVPPHLSEALAEKSTVLPVPIDSAIPTGVPRQVRPDPCIVWNHRWEYDKGMDRLLLFLRALKQSVGNFELIITGKESRTLPAQIESIRKEFAQELLHCGYCETRTDYLALLAKADFVLSTAIHEFQGIAVMEAVSAGCVPLLPSRLAYPELFPERYLYQSYIDQPELEANAVVTSLKDLMNSSNESHRDALAALAETWSWSELKPRYRSLLSSLFTTSL